MSARICFFVITIYNAFFRLKACATVKLKISVSVSFKKRGTFYVHCYLASHHECRI